MSLKSRIFQVLSLMIIILTISVAFVWHHLDELFNIASLYWVICCSLWGGYFIFLAVRKPSPEKETNVELSLKQKLFTIVGLGIALPPILNVSLWWHKDQVGRTSWPFVNTVEFIGVSFWLVILIYFELMLTISLIRSIMKIVSSRTRHKDPPCQKEN